MMSIMLSIQQKIIKITKLHNMTWAYKTNKRRLNNMNKIIYNANKAKRNSNSKFLKSLTNRYWMSY